jgi:hypothetical protein
MPSGFTVSYNFNRPNDATAYTANDLVANQTIAGNVTSPSFAMESGANFATIIRRVRLKKSSAVTAAASFRVHFYSQTPSLVNGDNGVWSTASAGYIGSIDLDMSGAAGRVFSDGVEATGAFGAGAELLSKTATVWATIQVLGAYVPTANETFTIDLECQSLNPR